MCNLYDIGPKRHPDGNEWETAITDVVSGMDRLFGLRKTDPGPVVLLTDGEVLGKIMRWGFDRPYNPSVNNARTDKLDGPWSTPWQERQRCLIPLSTFYEWSGPTGKKQTFAFQAIQPETWLWAAGIWEVRDEVHFYSMLTTAAGPSIERIHDRMPALINPAHFQEFLQARDPRHLLQPWQETLNVFRCENPLKAPASHVGPVPEETLPGFEGLD